MQQDQPPEPPHHGPRHPLLPAQPLGHGPGDSELPCQGRGQSPSRGETFRIEWIKGARGGASEDDAGKNQGCQFGSI